MIRFRTWALGMLLLSTIVLVTGGAAQAQSEGTSIACPDAIPATEFSDTGGLTPESVRAIDCVAHYGITSGTTAATFSPDDSLLRSQTARFLVRTAAVLGVELPSGESAPFEDLDDLDEDGRRSIARLWELGISRGAGSGTFEPEALVNRWQMALFLSRMLEISGVAPGRGGSTLPSEDVPYDDLAGWSDEIVGAIGYTASVGIEWPGQAGAFEPERLLTREETAVLLAGALEAGAARHVTLTLEFSKSSSTVTEAVVAKITATKPDGRPYRGLLVDLFVTQGHRYDGTCRVDADARVNGSDGGTSTDCTIDWADPRTNYRGEVTIGLSHGPSPETDRVFAWVGSLEQEYQEKNPLQVWADLTWTDIPNRVEVEGPIDGKYEKLVEVKARLLGPNAGGRSLVMVVLRQGIVVQTTSLTTPYNGKVSFAYVGPDDPSSNNDDPLVEVIRVFWDRNGNWVHDGPAEISDDTTATWDD